MECFTKNINGLMAFSRWHSILDVWQGSDNPSGLLKLFCRDSMRDTRGHLIYAKPIIVLTLNLEFSLYSEVIHGSATFKLTKGLRKVINYSIWCFWSFFCFLHSNIPDNKCYKQKWHVLFFKHIKLLASVLACVRVVARIKWIITSCFFQICYRNVLYCKNTNFIERKKMKICIFLTLSIFFHSLNRPPL